MPDMPIRLEAESIINDSNAQHKEHLLERSMSVTSSVVDVAYRDGFYRDGKNNIPISERARRVYVPDMPAFQGDADRHPNFVTEEYLEERRNRPQSQGSVLVERSARVRAANKRAMTAREARQKSSTSQRTSERGNQEESEFFTNAFSDYYQGLLPLNGVGEIEPESEFQLFLVQKQRQGGPRASTAPTTLGSHRGGEKGGEKGAEQCDDSMAFEESTTFEDRSKVGYGGASYASSLSRDLDDHNSQLLDNSQCGDNEDSLVGDWHEGQKEHHHVEPQLSYSPSKNTTKQNNISDIGQLVQSVDMLFP